MSALRITAEPGHLYLMRDGRRLRFVRWYVARVIGYVDEAEPTIERRMPGSVFESQIESVLE